MQQWSVWGVLGAALVVTGCGGGGGSDPGGWSEEDPTGQRGTLLYNPPLRTSSMSAEAFKSSLATDSAGQALLAVAGTPKCGVDIHYLQYGTVGGAGEATQASGALMVPSGDSAQCAGARPLVLYAHGTNTAKRYNLADAVDRSNPAYGEALLVAATYAAQGYIVVAPNYAGYDSSPLSYHPYLNADQQSKEMMDALSAARKAMPNLGTRKSGQLFITGYSQGGHVAMATHKAMQARGQAVTASAPMSGPYALGAFGDAVYYGQVNLGATLFTPLLATSYQKAYGNIYNSPADFYGASWAPGIESLLPGALSTSELIAQGKLPATTLFNNLAPTAPDNVPPTTQFILNSFTPATSPTAFSPLFAQGFGLNPLVRNEVRLAYLLDAMTNPDGAVPSRISGLQAVTPTHPLRRAFKANDLRNWVPQRPVFMCGGSADPTVFFHLNTQLMQSYWASNGPNAAPTGVVNVLDVDSAVTGLSDPYAAAKLGFATFKGLKAASAVAAGAKDGGASAVLQAYHGELVPPFCTVAARGFFQQVQASGQ